MSKRDYDTFVGYSIYNPCGMDMKSHIVDDGEIYFFLKDAKKACKILMKEYENPELEVLKLERVVK